MTDVRTETTLAGLGAAELARRIRARDVSSAEVVEAHIARIEEVNPRLNAVVVSLFEQARGEARMADREQEPKGLLHGVPITIKEQFDVAGHDSTWGLRKQRGKPAAQDGPMVSRLRQAGGIVLGITNVPQLLLYAESDNPVYGRANNPWSLDRTPGGSSGGEGAIIAAGGSPLGLGGDIGGSIRVPAHFCGIQGLKPTSWRLTRRDNPARYASGGEGIVHQVGPIARRVEDLRLAMEVLAAPGQDAFDWSIPPVPWSDPAQVDVGRLRIAMYANDGFFPAAPAVRRAVGEAAGALRAAGAEVSEWSPPDVSDAMDMFFGLLGADGGQSSRRLVKGDELTPQVKGLIQIVSTPTFVRGPLAAAMAALGHPRLAATVGSLRPLTADQFWLLLERANRFRSDFVAGLLAGGFDAVICPPHALPALTHGASYWLTTAASYSMLYNMLGMPAGVAAVTRVAPGEESDRPPSKDRVDKAAAQVERDSSGLPVGVQVVGRHWREDVVLAVMSAVEAGVRGAPGYPETPPL